MEYYSISCIPGSYLLILFYFRLLLVVCTRTTYLSVSDHEFYVNVKKNDLASLLTLSLSKTCTQKLKGLRPFLHKANTRGGVLFVNVTFH